VYKRQAESCNWQGKLSFPEVFAQQSPIRATFNYTAPVKAIALFLADSASHSLRMAAAAMKSGYPFV
jgi:hypothetical protein